MSELIINNYGQERERNATETELEIFAVIKEMASRDDLILVRKSDNYISACIGEWDLARIKYTPRAKWLMFPVVEIGSTKHRIESPDDVRQFSDELKMSLDRIALYSND